VALTGGFFCGAGLDFVGTAGARISVFLSAETTLALLRSRCICSTTASCAGSASIGSVSRMGARGRGGAAGGFETGVIFAGLTVFVAAVFGVAVCFGADAVPVTLAGAVAGGRWAVP